MDLIRLDSNPNLKEDEFPNDHRQSEYVVEKIDEIFPEDAKLKVGFPRFGLGTQRRSDFAVEISWLDVRRFVRLFIEIGHPDALHLQRVIRLAEKIESAGWIPNQAPSDEFWEILPS